MVKGKDVPRLAPDQVLWSHTHTHRHTHRHIHKHACTHTHACTHSKKKKSHDKNVQKRSGVGRSLVRSSPSFYQGPGLNPQHQKLNRKQRSSLRSQILGKRGQKDQEFKVVFGDLVSLRPLTQKQNKTKNLKSLSR